MILGSIIPGWKYVSAGVGILALGLFVWWILDSYVLTPRDLHEEEASALQAVCEDFQSQLLDHLNKADRRHLKLAIAPIPEETSNGQYRATLAKILPDADKRITIDDKNLLGKVKADGLKLIGSGDEPATAEGIFQDKPEINGVLIFERPQPTSTASEVQLKMKMRLMEKVTAKDGSATYPESDFESYQRVSFETGDVIASDAEADSSTGEGFWALFGMAVVGALAALGVPFLWLPLTDPIIGSGNNALGLAYLAVIVASAMLPYFLLVGFSSGGPIGFGILLLGISAVWTYKMHDAWSERSRI